jgi:Arc/MetJ-type ribon-helix-helix transcriptional regulator
MRKVDKVTIRLTPEQASAVDSLVEAGKYKNRSDAMRGAIDSLSAEPPVRDPTEVTMRMTPWVMAALEGLVKIKRFETMEAAVSELLQHGLLSMKVDEIKEQIRWMEEWGQKEKAASDIFEDKVKEYSNYIRK